jgi:hydroxymethylpyrimidine pyrophosphatase-like HAD family hydrolase
MTKENTMNFSTLPPIIAVDFDGTLVYDEFPEIGEERKKFCDVIRKLQSIGIRTILWTSRTGKALEEAVAWCEDHDLHFSTVNENVPEVIELTGGIDTRKVYADAYFDDRNRNADVSFMSGRVDEIFHWLGK